MQTTTEKEKQLASLNCLYHCLIEARLGTFDAAYLPTTENLSGSEQFLTALAQICDNETSCESETAVACLKGLQGPEYHICSNAQTTSKMQEVSGFIKDLLTHVIVNPDAYEKKTLSRSVLRKILAFHANKVIQYIRRIRDTLRVCTADCSMLESKIRTSPTMKLLQSIDERCQFELVWEDNSNSRELFISSCISLINVIQDTKPRRTDTPISGTYVRNHWAQLRYFIDRLHAYRLAAETITAARDTHPRSFAVFFVSSAPPGRSLVTADPRFPSVLRAAFADLQGRPHLDEELNAPPPPLGLEEAFMRLFGPYRAATTVHAPVRLHEDLAARGLTRPGQFWGEQCFFATSEPPCKLCVLYLDARAAATRTELRMRAPQAPLPLSDRAAGWRLPDSNGDGGEEEEAADEEEEDEEKVWARTSLVARGEVMLRAAVVEDMVEKMHTETAVLLRDTREQCAHLNAKMTAAKEKQEQEQALSDRDCIMVLRD